MSQQTITSGTITDPSGNPYKNCSYSVSLVNNTGLGTLPLLSGSTFQTVFDGGSCDSFGSFSQPLFDNNQITPLGTQWKFSVCDVTAKNCFTYTTPICPAAGCITGLNISISAAISALAPSLAIAGTPNLNTNNIFTGINTFTNQLNAAIFEGFVYADQAIGATSALKIQAACNTATLNGTVPGTVVIPATMATGDAGSIATGCSFIDYRQEAGNGTIFFASNPGASGREQQTGFDYFLYSCPNLTNCFVAKFDQTFQSGTAASTNYGAVLGLAATPAGSAVGGTNYGGFTTVFNGTASCTAGSPSTCTGTGTNFQSGGLLVGDRIAQNGSRTSNCARIVTVVTSDTSIQIDKDFGQAGNSGQACATGATPSGITLAQVVASEGTHGEGTNVGVNGAVGAASGSAAGNTTRPLIGTRGFVGSVAGYSIGVQGQNLSGNGPGGQFCFNNPCIYDASIKGSLDIQNNSSVSASGQEVGSVYGQTANTTIGSGPYLAFRGGAGTAPLPQVGQVGFQVSAANVIDFIVKAYNSGLGEVFRVNGAGNTTIAGSFKFAGGSAFTGQTGTGVNMVSNVSPQIAQPQFNTFFDIQETTAPAGNAGTDRCYGDSTAHAIRCSYNNGTFQRLDLPVYIAAGTQQLTPHIVEDSIQLTSGTPSTATVTLTGSSAFAGTTTYKCALTNETSQANPVKYTRVSASSFTITGPNTVTDTISFVCVGN